MYDSTPYKAPLAAFGKLMVEDGRSGHSPECIGRCVFNAAKCCACCPSCVCLMGSPVPLRLAMTTSF